MRCSAFLLAAVTISVLATFGRAASVSDADLTRFAQDYAHAVESGDPEKIKPFIDPDILANPSASEKQVIDGWFSAFKAKSILITDPVWITVHPFPPTAPTSFGKMHWKIRPQYAIQVQSYHLDGHGGEVGGNGMVDGVVQRDGKLYVVRPLPNP
jgi:hypothetical protein